MPELFCNDPEHLNAMADVMRLFYGQARVDGHRLAAAGDPVRLECRIIPAGGRHEVSLLSPAGLLRSTVPAGQVRREARRQLYQALSSLTGQQFPWGSLTGIRPTVMAGDALAGPRDPAAAADYLVRHWFVRQEQARLAVEVWQAEQQLLSRIPPRRWLAYLGVPFCPSRCAYCSFITQDAMRFQHLMQPMVQALVREIRELLPLTGAPAAIYFGGGTPTALDDRSLSDVLETIHQMTADAPPAEFTVEAGRPDTITRSNLRLIASAGADRICINPQTFHDRTLQTIGRRHTTKQTLQAYELAREAGFRSINLDLIAGLPGETPADFLSSVRQAIDLNPDSLTLHAMAIKRSSALHQRQIEGTPGFDQAMTHDRPQPAWLQAMREARAMLEAGGLHPYYLYRQKQVFSGLENVGYARTGEGSLYNVGMMSDQRSVLGLGCGAATKLTALDPVRRQYNPRQAGDYIARIETLIADKKMMISANATPPDQR
ncbi:MAG: coproporphyrinogen dehydrogenase HemZ [Eubacteriales bacterium]|nr:coproporphyrinogen dehydrogenase HemZ [Eubacteriales bacterium]